MASIPTLKPRDDKLVVVIKGRKPRIKNLNQTLMTLQAMNGGRMKDIKDRNRARDKLELQALLKDQTGDES